MTTSHHRTSGRATLASLVVVASLFLAAGSAAASGQKQATLAVEGMVCPNCEATVESVLLDVDGVLAAEADRQSERAIVTFDPSHASPEEMVAAINDQTYYQASVLATGQPTKVDGASADSGDGTSVDMAGSIGTYALLGLGVVVLAGAFYWVALRPRSDSPPSG